jgi:HK97 gp10 family phage protein
MSQVKNAGKLRRKLKRFPDEMTNGIKVELEEGIKLIQAEAVRRVPVDEGDLKKLLGSKAAVGKKDKGLAWQFGLRTGKLREQGFYALFVEYGTKGFNGTDARGRQISIPAQPERPFMRPAFAKYRKDLRKRIDKRVDEALRKVGTV